jgi:hypothetical protein
MINESLAKPYPRLPARYMQPHLPKVLYTLYELALGDSHPPTVRWRALKDILARGYARPTSPAEDPTFQPTLMSDDMRAQLTALLATFA